MKNDKYYTPTIEEFHVGFEYQLFNGANWQDRTVGMGVWDLKRQILHHLTMDVPAVRVKHLDRSDIESFGFKYVGKTIDNWYDLEGDFEIPMSNCRNMLIKMQHDFRTHQGVRIVGYEYNHNSGDSETLYRGSCKNKSELKRILTQIGVI